MDSTFFFAILIGMVSSAIGSKLLITYGKRNKILLKSPNNRDAHARPVVTSGGLAIQLPIILAAVWLQLPLWFSIGLIFFLVLGYLDDRYNWASWQKLLFQLSFLSILLLVYFPMPAPVGVLSVLQYVFPPSDWHTTNFILWLIFAVGFMNFYNFMDGLDGYASSGAILMLIGGLFFSHPQSLLYQQDWNLLLAISVGALLGFLVFNVTPAKIFMGDTGSLSLGFLILSFMLISAFRDARELSLWLIAGAVFFTDAVVTVVTLALRKQPFWTAHSLFAFQKLMRSPYFGKAGSHAKVVWLQISYSLLIIYPLLYFWRVYPEFSSLYFFIAYFPVFIFTLWLRAGIKTID